METLEEQITKLIEDNGLELSRWDDIPNDCIQFKVSKGDLPKLFLYRFGVDRTLAFNESDLKFFILRGIQSAIKAFDEMMKGE